MYECPYCEYRVDDAAERCPTCDGNLDAMARCHELPNLQFNRAVRAIQAGDLTMAGVHLAAVVAARVKDVEAWLLLGNVQACQGSLSAAISCWKTALAFDPGNVSAARAIATAEQLLAAQPAATEGHAKDAALESTVIIT